MILSKNQNLQQKIADTELRALLYEVALTPKPGLVDPVSNGGHTDMDIFMFIDSSLALRSYFETVAAAGAAFTSDTLSALFEQIRPLGLAAEKTMLAATDGVNTHKGAIFSLGILVAAAAYDKENIQATVQKMLSALIEQDFGKLDTKRQLTAGELQYIDYGLTGIRGEAAAGFPTVFAGSLPFLRRAKGTRAEQLRDTLMFIVSQLSDTTLIKRAGTVEILEEVQAQAQQHFTSADRLAYLQEMDESFAERHLSLGGAADLLILTIFLELLEKDAITE